MKREVGLWIDHRKAVIVTIENEVEVIREIRSNLEKHVRFSTGTRAKGPNAPKASTAEDMRDRQFNDHLGNYYDGIISFIRGAEAIWIFGPGEAKVEFKSHLIRGGLEGIIVGIDTVDKMTDHQISAKVREHFLR
ncbi:MAG TPA: hypothetical protein DCP32_04230 [Anaerolineaceae bacterium]|nr:hypothetical protein [Anaerolinea sp.]OGN76817.1 MAG: hypothetical protein A2X24_03480 [Chloroflexi bacterium GWB2_54_36]HAL15972.1 hypothetical protein [Anaerolineaceae bacterium]HBA91666.1 hypothetical protein [Anaerolineaceae bacterium]